MTPSRLRNKNSSHIRSLRISGSLSPGTPSLSTPETDFAVWCCGCAEWSLAMSTGGGHVWLRVRTVCVAGVAGPRNLRGGLVEDYRAQVLARARGQQV